MSRLTILFRILLSLPAAIIYIVFIFIPLLVLLRYSFATSEYLEINLVWTFANYIEFIQNRFYLSLLVRSLGIAALVSVLTLLIGYPAAWFISRVPKSLRNFLLVLLIIPWWASFIVRVFAWYTLFGRSGVINKTLTLIGMVSQPVEFFTFAMPAVVITQINLFLPLSILPIYMTLEHFDFNLLLAARGLGAGRWYTFRRVIFPLSLPGVIAGLILVFMPVAGSFIVPDVVGGTSGTMIGKVIASQFGEASNWALGSALAMILLIVLLFMLFLFTRVREHMAGEFH